MFASVYVEAVWLGRAGRNGSSTVSKKRSKVKLFMILSEKYFFNITVSKYVP